MTKESITRYEGEEIPAFEKRTYHYSITEELYNGTGIPLEERIGVSPAHTGEDLEMHVLYHKEGTSKSPIYARYETKADSFAEELIIFLNSRMEFCMEGAYVDAAEKDRIGELIRKLKNR